MYILYKRLNRCTSCTRKSEKRFLMSNSQRRDDACKKASELTKKDINQ